MARRLQLSAKRVMIDRANSTIVIGVGIAAFVTAFALVASRSLLATRSYQSKVIKLQEQAHDQLMANLEAVQSLKTAYAEFQSRPENIIKGDSQGDGERDGDNARIILDALPSKYDFPALASSMEKILVDRNFKILSLTGVDDELTQNPSGATGLNVPSATATDTTAVAQTTPAAPIGQAVPMAFQLSAQGTFPTLTGLLKVYKDSIRPISADQITFEAEPSSPGRVNMLLAGKSYYQPTASLKITEEVVK